MSKKDRWLTIVAFIVAVLPLIVIAFILKLLPEKIPITDINLIDAKVEYANKYSNLVTALLCLVPLLIVGTSRIIKTKLPEFKNYMAILIMSMVLSVAFTAIILKGLIEQVRNVEVLRVFDFVGFASVLVSIALALTGPITRYRKYDSKFWSINNRFSRFSTSVWKTIHHNAASVQTPVFTFVAVIASFVRGWPACIIFGVALVLFIVWTVVHSYIIKTTIEKRQKQHAKEIEEKQ